MKNAKTILKEIREISHKQIELESRMEELDAIVEKMPLKKFLELAKFKPGDCFLRIGTWFCDVRKIRNPFFYAECGDISYAMEPSDSVPEWRLLEGTKAKEREEAIYTKINKEEFDSFAPYYDMGYFKKNKEYIVPLYNGEWKKFKTIKEAKEYIKSKCA